MAALDKLEALNTGRYTHSLFEEKSLILSSVLEHVEDSF